jgi:hypothetical protein
MTPRFRMLAREMERHSARAWGLVVENKALTRYRDALRADAYQILPQRRRLQPLPRYRADSLRKESRLSVEEARVAADQATRRSLAGECRRCRLKKF